VHIGVERAGLELAIIQEARRSSGAVGVSRKAGRRFEGVGAGVWSRRGRWAGRRSARVKGGVMLRDYVIVSIYYGSWFTTGAGKGPFSWNDMDGALVSLTESSYFDGLRPLGLGNVTIHSSLDLQTGDPPSSWSVQPSPANPETGFTNDDVAKFIRTELDHQRVPTPDDFDVPPAYLVILKSGQFSREHSPNQGYHYDFDYQGQRYNCAWVTQGANLDRTTPVTVHEIVEIISSSLGYGERGDPCEALSPHRVGDVLVESYESAAHMCVVPNVFSQRIGTVPWMAWKGMGADQGIYYSWLDGDTWQKQIQVPGIASSDAPALAPHGGTLFMAWKGMDDDESIWYSQLGELGWAAQRRVEGVATSSHPSLCSHDGTLYLAWKGMGDDEGIYWTRWIEKEQTWRGQSTIPGRMTSTGVCLFGESALWMAWKGGGEDTAIYVSSYNPVLRSWNVPAPVAGAATSDTPAIAPEPAFVGDPDQFLMTWKGAPGDQRFYQAISTGGVWSPPVAEDGVATSSHPAVAATADGQLWRAWKGVDGDPAIWWASGDAPGSWSPQQVIPSVGTSHGPALLLF
jgi:hypothetical protein